MIKFLYLKALSFRWTGFRGLGDNLGVDKRHKAKCLLPKAYLLGEGYYDSSNT